jgi:pimeloyl-ACP methyl ester carboxylesterase
MPHGKWVAAIAAGVFLFASAASAQIERSGHQAPARRAGHVYLLRGLANIFSLGMDELAAKLNKAGIAASAHSYTETPFLAKSISAAYRAGNHGPVILMGHSNGADATVELANELNQLGVPVRLIVNFDPLSPRPVPRNVTQVVNYYLSTWWGAPVRPGPSFHGAINNVDLHGQDVGHFNIDKSERLHRQAIARVLQAVGGSALRKPAERTRPSATPVAASPNG